METPPQFPERARLSDGDVAPLEHHFATPFQQL